MQGFALYSDPERPSSPRWWVASARKEVRRRELCRFRDQGFYGFGGSGFSVGFVLIFLLLILLSLLYIYIYIFFCFFIFVFFFFGGGGGEGGEYGVQAP